MITVEIPAAGSIATSAWSFIPHIVQKSISGSRKKRFTLISLFAVDCGDKILPRRIDPAKKGIIIRAHISMNFNSIFMIIPEG